MGILSLSRLTFGPSLCGRADLSGLLRAALPLCLPPQYAEPTLADAVRPSVRRSKDHDRPHTRNRDGIAHCTTSTYGRHVRKDYGVQRATSTNGAACLLELQRNMGKIADTLRGKLTFACWFKEKKYC